MKQVTVKLRPALVNHMLELLRNNACEGWYTRDKALWEKHHREIVSALTGVTREIGGRDD